MLGKPEIIVGGKVEEGLAFGRENFRQLAGSQSPERAQKILTLQAGEFLLG